MPADLPRTFQQQRTPALLLKTFIQDSIGPFNKIPTQDVGMDMSNCLINICRSAGGGVSNSKSWPVAG